MKDIAIIIVSWNVKDKLRACLSSIEFAQRDIKTSVIPNKVRGSADISTESKSIDCEIFVVDNASHDGSATMVEQNFPNVTLIRNTYNAGCARAVNAAIKRANARYLLWLNPDMLLFGDTLEKTLEVADNYPDAGVIGARLEDQNGNIVSHIRRFPRFTDQIAIISKFAKIFPSVLNKYLCHDFNYDVPASVDSIRGSFFCMPRAALEKIGMLDERFFIWFEEVDYCKRVVDAGMKVIYDPRIRAVDFVGQSFKQVSVARKQKMWISSMLKYFGKHGIALTTKKTRA